MAIELEDMDDRKVYVRASNIDSARNKGRALDLSDIKPIKGR